MKKESDEKEIDILAYIEETERELRTSIQLLTKLRLTINRPDLEAALPLLQLTYDKIIKIRDKALNNRNMQVLEVKL